MEMVGDEEEKCDVTDHGDALADNSKFSLQNWEVDLWSENFELSARASVQRLADT
jgi:hypothetical protein